MTDEEREELSNLIYLLEIHHIDSSILFKMKNLIQKQKEEIERLKREAQKYFVTSVIQSKQYNTEIEEKNELIESFIFQGKIDNLALEKKDKIIDEIYKCFYEIWCKYPGTGMKILKDNGFDNYKCSICETKTSNCIDCIKQYFEKKVERSENSNEGNKI